MTYPTRFVLLLAALLFLPVLIAEAQTPVFKIEDQGGTTLLLVNDDGTITLPQGATNGFVLTTDANGNATWQAAPTGTVVTNTTLTGDGTAGNPLGLADDGVTGPAIHPDAIQGGTNVTVTRDGSDNVLISSSGGGGGGLTLPFAGSVADPGTAFSVENTGTGSAGQFSATDAAGLLVSSSNSVGASITATAGDAINIQAAGSPSTTSGSSANHGVEVQGAQGSGLYVGQADEAGVFVESGFFGLRVENANQSALRVANAFTHGLHVLQAQTGSGLFVDQSGSHGMAVSTAGTDGVFVGTAADDGVNVQSAGGDG
ncbi:MAG: hypothetical protein GVY18_16095, partial [Bacteroidetes bacterium]|nr:hypothetical protein [Bacteroidota bacterium]